MIWVTRLNGSEIVINADLIEMVESTPDTVVTLVDGKKYVISESAQDLVNRIRTFRVSILTEADEAESQNDAPHRAELYVLPTAGQEG